MALSETVRFGVIGLNRGLSFLRVCQAVGGATVTALYDVDVERARQLAEGPGAQVFDSLEAFLSAEIDAVVVASPVPFHAGQAAAALRAGKHVLSEVTAAVTLDEARELVEAQRAGNAVYMLAENYQYLDEVELLKRMVDAGRFGGVYYGEGEYLHDCRELWYDEAGRLTWRGRGGLGVYCTHSLGPLLYITRERVESVSALAVPGGKYDPAVTVPTMHLMQMVTDRGTVLRVRVDHVSPRPHQMAYYALQGTAGSYEAWRGFGDRSKVWLADEHGPSLFESPAQWHPLDAQSPRYIPDRLAAPPEARSGGHGTSEYWLIRDFLSAVRGEAHVAIDLHRGLDYTLPGICALESAARGGAPVAVPDTRAW
ncbi:MAG: Gfo/Idh/MocA family oxidoreductase [Chloroflexota bacterium]|nr:Gfo/Idh/MocA family oxidoreductase [Chloroflexota bacterium]